MKKSNVLIVPAAFFTAIVVFGLMFFKYQSPSTIKPANNFSKVVVNTLIAAAQPKVVNASDFLVSEAVDLSNQELTFIPADLFRNTSLKHLDFTNNSITSIPSQIRYWTNLEALNAGDNELTYLPAEIKYVSNLTTLDVNNNNLSFLPMEIGQLTKLKNLDLSNNQISEFPNEIRNLTGLETLTLTGNPVTAETLKLLRDSLKKTEIIF